MPLTSKLARIEKRIAALEAARLPPRPIHFAWIDPEPCGPDEELVVTSLERHDNGGSWRTIVKRKKLK